MFFIKDIDLTDNKTIEYLKEEGDTIYEYMIDNAREYTDAYYSILIVDSKMTIFLEIYNYDKESFKAFEEELIEDEKEYIIEIYKKIKKI